MNRTRLVSALLGITFLAPVMFVPELNPLMTLMASAMGALLLIAVASRGGAAPTTPVLVSLVGVLGLASWLCARAVLSTNPAVSFLGTVSQHSGAALWILAAAWLLATYTVSNRSTQREVLPVIAVCGAGFGLWGIGEAVVSGAREWGSAAGPFENSASQGSFLALAALAGTAWFLSTSSERIRLLAGSTVVLSLAGIVAANSRTGLLAVVVGLAVASLLYLCSPSAGRLKALAVGLPLLPVAVTAALTFLGTGDRGPVAEVVRALGTDRHVIWSSALTSLERNWLAGSGPELFSSWVQWEFAEGALSFYATYDPHNSLLGLALAGGLVAVALWLAATVAVMLAMTSILPGTRRPSPAVMLVLALPSVTVAATLFAWLTPASVIATAAILGCVLATVDARSQHRAISLSPWILRTASGLLAIGCVATLIFASSALPAERALVRKDASSGAEYAALYERWPDPAFATRAADEALRSNVDPITALQLLAPARQQARWHVDLALRDIFVTQRLVAADPRRWPEFVAAIEAGVAADPASGLWFTLAAAQADIMDRADDRREYARAALAFDLTSQDRLYLEELSRR